jgi:hypothetical protein
LSEFDERKKKAKLGEAKNLLIEMSLGFDAMIVVP